MDTHWTAGPLICAYRAATTETCTQPTNPHLDLLHTPHEQPKKPSQLNPPTDTTPYQKCRVRAKGSGPRESAISAVRNCLCVSMHACKVHATTARCHRSHKGLWHARKHSTCTYLNSSLAAVPRSGGGAHPTVALFGLPTCIMPNPAMHTRAALPKTSSHTGCGVWPASIVAACLIRASVPRSRPRQAV